MNPIEEILKLKDGESWTYPEGDYGKAEVWYKNGTYFLFEIPQYGGNPRYVQFTNYSTNVPELVEAIESWT
jgi:hypothetical protein